MGAFWRIIKSIIKRYSFKYFTKCKNTWWYIFTCDYAEVLSCVNIILIAVASPYIRNCISDMKKYISDNTIIICVNKGIEKETMKTMSEVIEDELNTEKYK